MIILCHAQDDFDAEVVHAAEVAEREALSGNEKFGPELAGAKKANTCSYQKFKKVERALILYIRSHEGQAGDGVLQHDAVEWYLDRQEELDSTVDLAAERKLVRRIIQRLVSIDKVIAVSGGRLHPGKRLPFLCQVLFVVTTATHVTERGVDSRSCIFS
mmetsp:Transcript_28966/g.79152  ORF Transcript_28966/g.79152 Transcript_28966/m.79152 type:complete len:159 (-) Transcript_28966:383-859(-)